MTATLADTLRAHAARLHGSTIAGLNGTDPERAQHFALRVGPVYANFARQRYDRAALDVLFGAAETADIRGCLRRMFDGDRINVTEDRAALHTALRSDLSTSTSATDAHAQASAARQRMAVLLADLSASNVTDIVSVGIGGSDLGPRLVVDALAASTGNRFRVHFLSNVDGAAAQRLLAGLDRDRTAVLLISKSFATQETLLNGVILRDWLGNDGVARGERIYAITANAQRAREAFEIPVERILPMWDWVGGRYSLWSAVGFPIALALGMSAFDALLAGAAEMDAHVLATPLRENLAVWHGVTAVWNRNALGLGSQAVVAYDERLKLLPNYLQQLVMESLGKSVRRDGASVALDTVPVWWGGVGTDTQHSFFQALHQGTQVVPMDLIGSVRDDNPYADNQRVLRANLLAQAEALANGEHHEDPHRAYAGNRPSTVLLLDALTPHALGALLALYEHSVFVQAVLWGINPFDQFGVELGKQVAGRLLPMLAGEGQPGDPVTSELIAQLRTQSSP